MAIETERKFLVKDEFRHLAISEIEIVQSYLSIEPDRIIRIRIANDKAFLTIKSRNKPGSIMRNEGEFPVLLTDAKDILKICLPGKIMKTRYLIPAGKHIFEVDIFHDKNEGLIIAEIELDSEDEAFEKPCWLGKEVTGMAEYYNSNLIK